MKTENNAFIGQNRPNVVSHIYIFLQYMLSIPSAKKKLKKKHFFDIILSPRI